MNRKERYEQGGIYQEVDTEEKDCDGEREVMMESTVREDWQNQALSPVLAFFPSDELRRTTR